METFVQYDNLDIGATRAPSPPTISPTMAAQIYPVSPFTLVEQLYGFMNGLATREPTTSGPKEVFDYFPLDAYGLNKEQLAFWKVLLVAIEGHKISVEGLAHPLNIASKPGLLISVTSQLLALHAADVACYSSVGIGPVFETVPARCMVLNTPAIYLTTPDGSHTLPETPTPRIPLHSINIHGTIYVGLQYNGVDIPGFFVNTMDLNFDGLNEVYWANKIWLKLRVIRENPRYRGKPSVLSGLGKELKNVEEKKHVSFDIATGLPLQLAIDTESEEMIKVDGDYYSLIRESGVLEGYMIRKVGSFNFGGLEWIEEVLVVPSIGRGRQSNRSYQL